MLILAAFSIAMISNSSGEHFGHSKFGPVELLATASKLQTKITDQIAASQTDKGTTYKTWYKDNVKSDSHFTEDIPFDAIFVSWALKSLSISCVGIPSASASLIYDKALGDVKKHSDIFSKYDARPGDVAIITWDTSDPEFSEADHVAIVKR